MTDDQGFRCNKDGIARVWAYIGDNDPTRGECHGSIGLAQRVAEKLNGQMLCVDQAMLDSCFVHTDSIVRQFHILGERHGHPDIVIGWMTLPEYFTQSPKPTILIPESLGAMRFNLFSGGILRDLPPHHLSADRLAAAQTEFLERHPGIATPLTAIFTTDLWLSADAIEHVSTMIWNGSINGTIYLCPSRRTDDAAYDHLRQIFESAAAKPKSGIPATIIAPTWNDIQSGYNPYNGLVAAADNVIMLGESDSILSECITNGRPVYNDTIRCAGNALVEQGYVRDIMRHDPSTALDSHPLRPVNSTHIIADHIVAEFDRVSRLRITQPGMVMHEPCRLNGPKPVLA
ncbi:ELM1/GtrOC1 family putative glycosyltransferase [Micavibrio aeruginosavorus]|uniref:ELM1/GtrOC1 family putative glycosyltransferase n=1 Tax=Micavibrio aeruginosavorus TaxID=349221 RepID=UPI003F4ACDE2